MTPAPLRRLTVWIRDTRSGSTIVHSFHHSPVTVGRAHGNKIQLRARDVARYHGAFLLGGPNLHYVDLGSSKGTKVDGRSAEPEVPVAVRDTSAIAVGPFEIRAQLGGVDTAESWPFVSLTLRWDPHALLVKALQVVEILACALVEARAGQPVRRTPLGELDEPERIIEYLLDPQRGDEVLDELIRLLDDLLRASSRTH